MSMKANKITLTIQTVGMYLAHLPLYILFVLSFLSVDDALLESLTHGLLIATLVMMALLFFVCILNIVFSVISIFKGETDPSKTVMKVKLALIPWYVLNFIMGILLVSIFLNPFFMIAIPVAIAILVATTYFYMFSTSLPDVAYYLRRVFIKKREDLTSSRIFAVVCLSVLCMDVVGGILFYRQNKKAQLSSSAEGDLSEIE